MICRGIHQVKTNIRNVNQVFIEDYRELHELMNSKLFGYEKVIVLGCSGMLGSYITSILVLHYSQFPSHGNIPVVGVSRQITKKIQDLQIEFPETFKQIDYSQISAEFVLSKKVLVIHAASPSSIQSINIEPYGAVETNIELTINVLKMMEERGGHILFLSSGEVYGDLAPTPTSENDYSGINHLAKRGLYPEMKRAAEAILQTYCDSSDNVSATSLRVFHTFGPGLKLDDPRIFGIVCKSIINKSEIVLNSDGSTIRVFLYTRDLMSAILHTIEGKGFKYFNVAGTEPISIADFCDISRSLGVPKVIVSDRKDKTPRNTQVGFADVKKLEALGWKPSVSVLEALERTAQSFQD
jgi:nucleoside-diphosphate-sugar epimerase